MKISSEGIKKQKKQKKLMFFNKSCKNCVKIMERGRKKMKGESQVTF